MPSASRNERLRQDWYYRHAHYADLADDQVLMTFGQDDQGVVFELLAPVEWRATLQAELAAMLKVYDIPRSE